MGDSLARRFGKANRDKLDDFGKRLFNINIDSSNSSVTNWSIEGHRGGMISSGIGSGITGEGADCLIIDDPIKNRQEANSQTFRDRIWNEWQSTLYTRLHPGGSGDHHPGHDGMRMIQQAAYSIPTMARWRIGRSSDCLPRRKRTTHWGGRRERHYGLEIGFDAEWMEKTKAMVGSGVWNALYQQRPSPEEGNIVNRNWWQYHKQVHPDDVQMDEIIQSWDCSFKETGNSYVVGQVWGIKGPNKYLLDQFPRENGFPRHIEGHQADDRQMAAGTNEAHRGHRQRPGGHRHAQEGDKRHHPGQGGGGARRRDSTRSFQRSRPEMYIRWRVRRG